MKKNINKPNQEEEKEISLERKETIPDTLKQLEGEVKRTAENKEQKLVPEALRREIELMEVDENLKEEAHKKAQKIRLLGEEEKIKNLLEIAKTKGVVAAIKTAKALNDPYLLDTLHDILAREGYYREFTK